MPGEPYVTLDGSTVRELVRPETEGSRNLSVAEAVLTPGQRTHPHVHRESEEVYYVLAGEGLLNLGARRLEIRPGDAILISPGCEHSVLCAGPEPLRILCLCSPPYQHEDTEITGPVTV